MDLVVATKPAPDAAAASAADIVALAIAGLALVVSIGGTVLANRRAKASNRIAGDAVAVSRDALDVSREALEDARDAKVQALWSDAIEAVHRVIVDPTTEAMQERLTTMRIRVIALVDGLPDWHGFDRWLAVEHTLGAALGRQVMERSRPNASGEEHLETLRPFMDWGMALAQNLRHFRNIGYTGEAVDEMREHAWKVLRGVYARNGWGEPPSELQAMQEEETA